MYVLVDDVIHVHDIYNQQCYNSSLSLVHLYTGQHLFEIKPSCSDPNSGHILEMISG